MSQSFASASQLCIIKAMCKHDGNFLTFWNWATPRKLQKKKTFYPEEGAITGCFSHTYIHMYTTGRVMLKNRPEKKANAKTGMPLMQIKTF